MNKGDIKMEEEDTECISIYFAKEEILPAKSPLKIPIAEYNLESSQNLSQDSIRSDTDLSLSQLDIEEPEHFIIPPFFNITPRGMPASPHYVIEEDFSSNPWAMLIATIFLTKISGKIAKPYLQAFFNEYPTPYDVLDDHPSSLERFFENLGLKKRGHIIWRLSYQFVSSKWRRASDLYGIGKYGEDAFRIFYLGHTDLDPGDRYLKLYLDWLRGHTEFLLENGIDDCQCLLEHIELKYYEITLQDSYKK